MPQYDAWKTANGEARVVKNAQSLNLIVGDRKETPCNHETFERFKLWVAESLARRKITTYSRDNVVIEHWDDQSGGHYPHLLNPCECGTYLPIEIEPTPMFSSAIGLLSDLNELKNLADAIPAEFEAIIDAMMRMAELSLATNTALEIK